MNSKTKTSSGPLSKSQKYQLTQKTYDEIAARYSNRFTKRGIDISHYQKFTSYLKGKRILDAGCASGAYTGLFVKDGYETIGIDFSKGQIELAKAKVPQAKFFQMDLKRLNFPKDYFDGIWCAATLLHINREDLAMVLKNLVLTLKDGGIFYLSVLRGDEEQILKQGAGLRGRRLFVYYQENELRQYLNKTGFEILEIYNTIPKFQTDTKVWIHIIAKRSSQN